MMIKKYLLLCTLWVCSLLAVAQGLTIRDIAHGKYRTENIYGMHPMKDGEHYTRMSADRKQILRYSFKTGKQVDVLFDVSTARNHQLKSFDGYIFSPNEELILIQTKTTPIYRRSFTAEYYIYTVKNNKLAPLSENGAQQVPLFSPDGNQIAFVRENNIFLVKLLFDNAESQVTRDGERNKVLNGIPDWVYEEEFSYNCAFDFSADSKMLAYVRFDESDVATYSFPIYKGMAPALGAYADYPGDYTYKYPKAGYDNSRVTVHTFDIKSRVTRKVDLPLDADGYIPRIKFTSDPEKLAIMTLNRHQNRFDIYMANPRSLICKLAIRDEAEQYIKEEAYGQMEFYTNHIVLPSERDGYNHLYLYDLNGTLLRQLTKGKSVVRDFLGFNEATGECYYTSTEGNALNTLVCKTDAKGKTTVLTPQEGTNKAIFSANFRYFMNTFSDLQTPTRITLNDEKGKVMTTLLDNQNLKQQLASIGGMGTKEFISIPTAGGIQLNAYIVKPANFDPTKKYPVIMHQYSGPGSQQVLNQWNVGAVHDGALFESYMCSRGFICVSVDGRGTGGRGNDFEKVTYRQLGVLEAEDQAAAARYLSTLQYVDGSRIGIWGWSFGGYTTLMAMSVENPVFRAGVAIAAPSDWRFYDTVYIERFMRTPKENADGYRATSAIERAPKLSGNLLLIHGTADDNVHYQQMAEYAEALVQANKQFDMQVYTNRNHFIMGGNTRTHLYERVANFFIEHLK